MRDEQVLLNDGYYVHARGFSLRLATDGSYGPRTTQDVAAFNAHWADHYYKLTTGATWFWLCDVTGNYGFRGAYWLGAGCLAVLHWSP